MKNEKGFHPFSPSFLPWNERRKNEKEGEKRKNGRRLGKKKWMKGMDLK